MFQETFPSNVNKPFDHRNAFVVVNFLIHSYGIKIYGYPILVMIDLLMIDSLMLMLIESNSNFDLNPTFYSYLIVVLPDHFSEKKIKSFKNQGKKLDILTRCFCNVSPYSEYNGSNLSSKYRI